MKLWPGTVLAALVAAAPAWAQPPTPEPTSPAPATVAARQDPPPAPSRSAMRRTLPLPVDIPRIEREAPREPAIKIDDDRLRFYAETVAKPRTWTEIVGDYDLMNGPTRGGAPMTHKEFLQMVTPKELDELFGGTTANSLALAQAAIVNAVGQNLIKKAVQAIRSGASEDEVMAIRRQIDRELNSLHGRTPQ